MFWLHASHDPAMVMASVVSDFGWTGTPKGELLPRTVLQNLATLDALGCVGRGFSPPFGWFIEISAGPALPALILFTKKGLH